MILFFYKSTKQEGRSTFLKCCDKPCGGGSDGSDKIVTVHALKWSGG